MPLVRLEVDNFKSYRGKQVIGPFHSFTAVIGPNGAGKSNLMDALSFVLGIKSSQLRSSQLKDLIYRGGAGDGIERGDAEEEVAEREGAVATRASVTAVYQDRKEVEYRFMRSVTLSGASEYRVNNRVVTAAAYNDRLKQFNILVKAKNFLVFQGDVEAVASQNPKDLCRLIDQISGSLEYKDEYEAARIAQTKAVERHRLAQMKRRETNTEVNQLKGEKSEAERFQRLQRERDSQVLQHVLWQLFHLNKKFEADTKDLKKKRDQLPDLKRQVTDAEKNVKVKRKEQGEAGMAKLQGQKSIREKEREEEKRRLPLVSVETKIEHEKKKLNRAEEMCKEIEPEVLKYKTSIAKYESSLEKVQEAADRASAEQASASAADGIALSERDLEEYHELKSAANLRAIEERQKLQVLSREIKTRKGKLQSLQEKLGDATKQKEKQEGEAESLREREFSLQASVATSLETMETVRKAQEEAEEKTRLIREQMDRLNETLQDCLTKLSDAGVAQNDQRRERQKKEQVAKLQKQISGVHGRFVDLCRPTQSKYDVAIATVLGKYADAVVVETQQVAMDCIAELKSTRGGQATFVPLDSVQVKEINERLRSISSEARLAFDVIQYDAKMTRAMQYAFGNTLVCDSMAVAKQICYEKAKDAKAVTLEGNVIHKNGLISGGRLDDTSSKRWEDREVEGLHRLRDRSLEQLKTLGKERHEIERHRTTLVQISSVEAEYNRLKDELNGVSRRLSGLRDEIKALDRQIAQLSPSIIEAQRFLDESTRQTTSLQARVDEEDDTIFADFCQRIHVRDIRQYEQRQLALMQQQVEARQAFEQQIKRLQHSIEFEKEQLKQQESRLAVNRESVERRSGTLQELRRERKEMNEALKDIEGEIEELKEAAIETLSREAAASEALKEARLQAERAQAKLDTRAKEIASLQLERDLLVAEKLKLYRRCRLEEIKLPLQSSSAPLSKVTLEDDLDEEEEETQEATPDSMDVDDDSNDDIQKADHGVKVDFSRLTKVEKQDGSSELGHRFQSRIDEAVAELEKIVLDLRANDRLVDSERRLAEVDGDVEKLRRDSVKAQNEFSNLRRIRCNLFNRAFEHMSAKIDPIYKELTRSKTSSLGGQALLMSKNSEEPFEGEVEFSATPPSKAYRGIHSLSGGEKTMAAIALLFALQSVFPAPFIVLDEVDAALDSANVQRVADYIRARASKDLQFIVISHKASLYERSSSLVGVMRKHEIRSSATLTLDLEQYA